MDKIERARSKTKCNIFHGKMLHLVFERAMLFFYRVLL